MPPPPQRGRGRGYQDDRQGGGGGQRGGGGRGRGYQDDRQGGGGQWGGGGRGRGYQDDRQGGGGGRGRGYQDDRQGQRGGGGGYRGRGAPRGRQDRGGYGQSRGGYGGGGDRYAAQSRQQWNPFPEGPGSHPKREKVKYKGADLGIEIKLSLQDSNNMPKKPPPGKLGQKIKLMSNCFAMKAPSGYVYHYDVEVCNNNRQSTTTGKETAKSKKYVCLNTKRNREVIDKLLSTNPLFEGAYGAYDGKKNLLCRSKLNIVGEDLKCAVHVPKRDSIPVPGTEQQMDEFEVVLKPVRKKESNDCAINLDTLHAVYADVLKSPPQDAVMALETILRHGPCMRFTPVGRSFFYPPLDTDLHPLGGGLEIWFGYHQSVRLGEWSPIVNLDVSSTAFHQAKKMIDLIADVLEVDPQGLHNMGTMRDYQRKAIDKKYRNMQIEVTHLPYPRKYKYFKLTQVPANRLDFTLEENGVEVRKTVQQFFRERHNKELEFPHLPCIQVLPENKRNYLPIEVCRLSKGQHCKSKLNPEQTAEMIKFSARPPSQRFHEIKDIREKRAAYEQDPLAKGFEMSVYNEPLQLEGRVLDVPGVLYRDNHGEKKITPANGAWNMQGTRYIRGAEIGSWVLYNFSNSRFCNNDVLKMFAKTLVEVANKEGIEIEPATNIQTFNPHQSSMVDILGNAKKRFKADLAVLVLPGGKAKDSIYKDIKQAAETGVGLVTQCIIDKNLTDRKDKTKCSLQLVSNLCQKINAKMGGVNNSLISGEMPAIFREPVMIIGADVTHSSPAGDLHDGISIAAVVASLDKHPSRYAVSIRAQKHRDENKESLEIIVELDKMVEELLLAFFRHTKQKKPRRIVFYRDGVSEGQFNKVREKEMSAVRRACKRVQNDGYEPPITFIVVQKRHHTRFMPSDERDGTGRMKNIPPGTTIDTVVTHPLYFDFFQCSHTGIQGTSKPCHYTVLHDDNNFSADDLQKLTFYLCHTYARCTRSIACPPPVMYADLAAYRAGKYLSEEEGSSSGSSVGGASRSSKQSKSSSLTSEQLLAKVQKEIKTIDFLADTMYFV